jgi:hypothetical protein
MKLNCYFSSDHDNQEKFEEQVKSVPFVLNTVIALESLVDQIDRDETHLLFDAPDCPDCLGKGCAECYQRGKVFNSDLKIDADNKLFAIIEKTLDTSELVEYIKTYQPVGWWLDKPLVAIFNSMGDQLLEICNGQKNNKDQNP